MLALKLNPYLSSVHVWLQLFVLNYVPLNFCSDSIPRKCSHLFLAGARQSNEDNRNHSLVSSFSVFAWVMSTYDFPAHGMVVRLERRDNREVKGYQKIILYLNVSVLEMYHFSLSFTDAKVVFKRAFFFFYQFLIFTKKTHNHNTVIIFFVICLSTATFSIVNMTTCIFVWDSFLENL